MVKAAEDGNRNQLVRLSWWRLRLVEDRCITFASLMWTLEMIIILDEHIDEAVEKKGRAQRTRPRRFKSLNHSPTRVSKFVNRVHAPPHGPTRAWR